MAETNRSFREELRRVRIFSDGGMEVLPFTGGAIKGGTVVESAPRHYPPPAPKRKDPANMTEEEVNLELHSALLSAGFSTRLARDTDEAVMRLIGQFSVGIGASAGVWRATLNVGSGYGSWSGPELRPTVRRAVLVALRGVSSGNS